jgi:hypothetical protein
MSYYYKYEFVSPEPIFAVVKEKLKSYFNTGVLDDLMFENYLNDCIAHLSNSRYKIEETVLELENFEAQLPECFHAVREAWLCTKDTTHYRTPSSYYYQKDCRVTRIEDNCNECFTPQDPHCTPCHIPEKYRVTHKVTGHNVFEFTKHYLLKPGNISKKGNCDLHCKNYGASAPDSFDVAGNTFRTNFTSGTVYLIYYSENFDDTGFALIPDNFRIRKYIEKYLIYECFSELFNSSTDETFNQLRIKKADAERERDEALIEAKIELKKETTDQKVRAIKKSYNRNRKYNIR